MLPHVFVFGLASRVVVESRERTGINSVTELKGYSENATLNALARGYNPQGKETDDAKTPTGNRRQQKPTDATRHKGATRRRETVAVYRIARTRRRFMRCGSPRRLKAGAALLPNRLSRLCLNSLCDLRRFRVFGVSEIPFFTQIALQ